jgi:cysteine desulfurase
LNVSFDPLENQVIIRLISDRIACSTGSACETDSVEESRVWRALGLREKRIHSSLRFGLGKDTTGEEVDAAIEAMETATRRLGARGGLDGGHARGGVADREHPAGGRGTGRRTDEFVAELLDEVG